MAAPGTVEPFNHQTEWNDIENLENQFNNNKLQGKPFLSEEYEDSSDYYRLITRSIGKFFYMELPVPTKAERHNYRKCKRSNTTVSIIVISLISYLLYFIIFAISLVNNHRSKNNETSYILNICSLVCGLSACVSGFVILLLKFSSGIINKLFNKFIYVYEIIYYFGILVGLCLQLFSQIIYGECHIDSYNIFESMICNSNAQLNMIPSSTAIFLLATPLLFQTTFQSVVCEAYSFGLFLSYLWVIFVIIYMKAIGSIPLLLVMFIFTAATANARDIDQSNFLNLKRLEKEKTLENEKNEAEHKASELRIMIGNVSHDLKTPLAAFLAGAEIINMNLKDALISISEMEGETKPKAIDLISSSIQTAYEIQNINSFMLMTINRCIEFTKTSKGIALSPTFETIEIQDCVQFPITCMGCYK